MSTLSTLRNKVRLYKQKIDKNGRVWSDPEINDAIVQSVRQIQQDGNFDWYFNDAENSETTVVSTGTYALATGFVRIEGTVKYNSNNLSPADYRWLKNRFQSLAVNGTPSYYYLRGSNIGLYPRPDDTKTLEYLYRKKLTEMSGDTDDSGMPSDFDEAITQYASYLIWATIQGREDKAIQAVQNYKQAMEGLNAQYLGRRDDADISFKFETINDFAQ